ncbi:MAG TPA: C2H2-type zinc finger protein [Nitrososphaeraceae archaeon]|nr:C2H2-type zinc finger protein [Nitrososphaeraceae archaeon]
MYKCTHCEIEFSRKWNLERHMKTHGRSNISQNEKKMKRQSNRNNKLISSTKRVGLSNIKGKTSLYQNSKINEVKNNKFYSNSNEKITQVNYPIRSVPEYFPSTLYPENAPSFYYPKNPSLYSYSRMNVDKKQAGDIKSDIVKLNKLRSRLYQYIPSTDVSLLTSVAIASKRIFKNNNLIEDMLEFLNP